MSDIELVALANAMQGIDTTATISLPPGCWSNPQRAALAGAIAKAYEAGKADEVGVALALGENSDTYRSVGGLP